MKTIIFLLLTLTVIACSTTFTGPVSGKKYNLDVGCTEDMQLYREQRKSVIDEIGQDCRNVE